MKENWLLINRNSDVIKMLSLKLGISELMARLLANRDILDEEQGRRFLFGKLQELYDGFSMKDMQIGVEIIAEAIKKNKYIAIYGDYDCDGVISTTIFHKALERCGARYKYHIPNREEEGYGMNSERIKLLYEEGVEVILTCDNGIAAFEQVQLAKNLGMKVVLTDHHDIPFVEEQGKKIYHLPNADAVINPKRKDCEYPFKNLCGAGVALKFVQCLYKMLGIDEEEALKLVEYAAIATVCDVVDLLDENRIIVKAGLNLINNTDNLGLKALIKESKLEDKKINVYHLGFVIGPCINATGRLETADLSVELLLTKEETRAEELAKELVELNKIRQDMTSESVERVINQIEKNNMQKDKVLLVYNDQIHESIAGIVAGRVKERYNVPTIIMTKGKEMLKGSGRSIEGYNMFEELSKCKELLSKFGGHPMAAGLSVEEEKLPLLREKLLQNTKLTEEDLIPKIRIDMRLPLNFISEKIINDLQELEPFGKGNSVVIFGEKGVQVNRLWIIGKNRNIIKFRFKLESSLTLIDGICFDKFEEFKEMFIEKYGEQKLLEIFDTSFCNFKMDFLFYPQINEYNGNKSIQVVIKNIRL